MRKFFSNSLIFILSFIFAFLLLEAILRLNDQNPWGNFTIDLNEPTINQPDKIKGWDLKPGKYVFEPYSDNGKKFNVTVNSDKSRFTGIPPKKSLGDIAIFGGSISMGHGVDDKENYPFFLQQKLNNYTVKNYSVGGYGTYQSFLKIEEMLKKNKNIKSAIIDFDNHAESKNIGDEFWLRTLTKYSKRGVVALPYASLNNEGKIVRHKPVKYLKLPLREKSTVIAKIEKRIMKYRLKNNQNPTLITKAIILEIKKLLDNNNVQFFFLNFESKANFANYSEMLKRNEISYINCEIIYKKPLIVEGEGHPNSKQHKNLSNCLFKNISKFYN
tara:strand:- start:55 stop:1041 length:987 start_codon:yes stop_codon:yes gene_type:complete